MSCVSCCLSGDTLNIPHKFTCCPQGLFCPECSTEPAYSCSHGFDLPGYRRSPPWWSVFYKRTWTDSEHMPLLDRNDEYLETFACCCFATSLSVLGVVSNIGLPVPMTVSNPWSKHYLSLNEFSFCHALPAVCTAMYGQVCNIHGHTDLAKNNTHVTEQQQNNVKSLRK